MSFRGVERYARARAHNTLYVVIYNNIIIIIIIIIIITLDLLANGSNCSFFNWFLTIFCLFFHNCHTR